MVYKEEVFSWFKELTGSRRIEVMCGLLNMCFPLELRFFGTCLEDLAGKDFPMLREAEQRANNVSELSKLTNIKDSVNRSKLIVSLALLNSSNRSCSDVIFKTLHDEVNVESWSCLSVDEKCASEVLLLLTMALHHPAFTHEQRSILAQHLIAMEKLFEGDNSKVPVWRSERTQVCTSCSQITPAAVATLSPPPVSCEQASVIPLLPATTSVQLSVATSTVIACTTACPPHVCTQCTDIMCRGGNSSEHILDIEVKEIYRKKSCKIQVNWSNGKSTEILKTHHEILDFCKKVSQLTGSHEKDIPCLNGIVTGTIHVDEITDDLLPQVTECMRHLVLQLPPHLVECDLVTNFFHQVSSHASGTENGKGSTVTFPENGPLENTRVRSLTIYNSQMSDTPSTGKAASNSTKARSAIHNSCSSGRGSGVHAPAGVNSITHSSSPVTSPLSSPMSSPYVSPSASVTSSRSASPWTQRHVSVPEHGTQNGPSESLEGLNFEQLLKIERLNKYLDKLHDYTPEELKAMPDEKLRRLGLTLGAVGKLRKLLENYRSFPNGVASHSVVPSPAVSGCPSSHSVNNAQLMQNSFPEVSSESSPSGSEYSSPPPSPSPLDPTCLQSSNTSSSEESLNDKGNLSQKSDGKSSSSIGSNSGRENTDHLANVRRRGSQNPAMNSMRKSHNRSQENGPTNKYITDTLRQNALNLTMAAVAQPVNVVPNHPHVHHQTHKLAHLPLHPRTSLSPAHIGAGTIVFENSQYGRFNPVLLSHNNVPRSHSGTPERTLPVSASVNSIFPYAVITSGGTAVLTPSRSVTTYRNSGIVSATTVVSSGNNAKVIVGRECDSTPPKSQQQQMPEMVPALYTTDSHYLIPPGSPGISVPSTNAAQVIPTSMSATSSCSASISSGHHPANSLTSAPSPAPPSQPPPVSVSYNCLSFLPQLFPQTFPFMPSPTTPPTNGFISSTIPTPPHASSFPFPLPNGISTAVTPEIIYTSQGFHLPSPSPSPTPTPGPVQQAPPSTPSGPPPPPPPPPNARYLAYVGACGFPPPQGLSHPPPNTVPMKPFSCYNCGALGHRGSDCKDSNFDELTKAGQYRLNYVRTSKPMESPE